MRSDEFEAKMGRMSDVLKTQMIKDIKPVRKGTEDDLEAIHNDDWRDAIDVSDLSVYEGNLSLNGNYDGSGGALLVQGDLKVAGTVALDETGSLIVTGKLTCKNLSCEGNLEIQGDTKVEETIFGFYEAGISFFDGALRARLFLEGNHGFEYDEDTLDVKTHIKFDNFSTMESKKDAATAKKVLSDDAIKVIGNLIGISTEDDDEDNREKLLRTKGYLR